MKLFTDIGNTQALKVLIICEQQNIEVTVEIVKLEDTIVTAKFDNKLPAIVCENGETLLSVTDIIKFIMESSKGHEDCQSNDWITWEANNITPLVHHIIASKSEDGKMDQKLVTQLINELQPVDSILKTHSFLCGTSITTADVCIWSSLVPLLLGPSAVPDLAEQCASIYRWFTTLRHQSEFEVALQKCVTGDSIENLITASLLHRPAPSLQPPTPIPTAALVTQISCSSSASTEAESSSQGPVSADELTAALAALAVDSDCLTKPKPRVHPVLPVKGEKNVLVTSALPYVNNVPHLGNIIGCVLSADVYARFCRLRNYTTLYVCGTDEYGTATENRALLEGVTPQQICDKYNKLHTEIYKWFNIDFDKFGRTTTPEQTQIAQDIFWKLHENGHILKQSVDQLRCESCERYLADRFVEGICPFCSYDDARGDQCDKCGKLINAVELKNPRCKTCNSTPVVRSSDHLFMDLPGIEPKLKSHLDKEFERGIWTHNTKVITRSWIRDGLRPRCISRDLKWGTPVPLEDYTNKVFYVWYDAPIGYISITATYTPEWEKWWKNPEEVELYQFMAKDNVPFHSVIFPSELLGTGQKWTIVNHLSATEYLNYEDGKFSKSRGIGVFGNHAQDTGIPADNWRFYLLYIRPESQDSAFSWVDFMTKNNSELLNNLGNFINRALKFVSNSFGGRIPAMEYTTEDGELIALISREIKTYIDNLENIKLRDGLRNILSISRLGNQYIQANQPWVLVKGSDDEKIRAGTVVGVAANVACLISVLLQPYMPHVSSTIQQQLDAPSDCNVILEKFACFLKPGHQIGTPSPLFQKIEQSLIDDLQKKYAGQQEQGDATSKPAATAEEIEQLNQQVSKQGDMVRQLKSSGASKETLQPELTKLLQLKDKLAAAQGTSAKPGKKSANQKQGKKANQKPANKAVANQKPASKALVPTAPPEEIERLGKEVAKQAELVREVKATKAEKVAIDAEIEKLLELKRQLAIAQGKDPNAVLGGKKKKKDKQED